MITTTYLGLPLKSPIIVAASSLSNMVDRIKRAEQNGAGALVIRSLFEEQILAEQSAHDQGTRLIQGEHLDEARMYFPTMESHAALNYLYWVKKSCEAVQMPLIASLNAVNQGNWVYYATELEKTGIAALELNIYSVEADTQKPSAEIEAELFEIIRSVRQAVKIPIAVKLSPFYTSVSNVSHKLDELGVNGLVLFNRFLQPDIHLDDISLRNELHFSTPEEMKLPLRWVAILAGRVQADLALTTGVHTGKDTVKAILAGAQVVQVASALYQHGLEHLQKMNDDLQRWMMNHDFESLEQFRGQLSQKKVDDPRAFERAQYVRLLMGES